MFPGQPLAYDAALPADDDFAAIAAMVQERSAFDLFKSSWTDAGHTEHVGLQLHGVAMSLYLNRRKRREGVQPAVVAEHSMGIYGALAACGVLAEADAIEMTWRVGTELARMGETRSFALGCIIGLTADPLLAIADNHGVHLANHNTSRHFLLSGLKANMEAAVAEALASGAFSAKVFLCDAPLHTPLIAERERALRSIFADYRYQEPSCILLDHLDQKRLLAGDLPEFLYRQLCMPVYWERTYRALVAMGVEKFHEIGAGDALKKYNRWIESERDR
jgi:malonyl CoA-acyl carrier protein transacylase